jgi:hypothetical protein
VWQPVQVVALSPKRMSSLRRVIEWRVPSPWQDEQPTEDAAMFGDLGSVWVME